MAAPQASAGLWLIKSGGKILGPFSQSEIEAQLRSRDLVILDEACYPSKTWGYLRDIPLFAKIVEEIRMQNLRIQDGTQPLSNSDTMTLSLTEPVGNFVDDLTDEVASFISTPPGGVHVDGQQNTAQANPQRRATVSAYGVEGDVAVRKKVQDTSRTLWMATALILLGVVGAIVFKQFIASPVSKGRASVDHFKSGIESLAMGDYPTALIHFRKVQTLSPERTEALLFLAPLLLEVDGNALLARRYLEEYLKLARNPDAARAHTALALVSLHEKNLGQAAEHLERAVRVNPGFVPAEVAKGMLAMENRNFAQAVEIFSAALRHGEQDNGVVLMRAQAGAELWRETSDVRHLNEARVVLEERLRNQHDYRQEMQFFLNYLRFLGGRPLGEDEAKGLLEIDPAQTADHRHNLFISRARLRWAYLSRYCEAMQNEKTDRPRQRAWFGLCLLQAGQRERAKDVLEDALQRGPKDPLVHATVAFFYKMSGDDQRYITHLSKAQELNRAEQLTLPALLQARFNQDQGNDEGAVDTWRELLVRESAPLAAHSGIADFYFRQQNYTEFVKNLEAGTKKSPHYKPFLQLQLAAKKAGVLSEDLEL